MRIWSTEYPGRDIRCGTMIEVVPRAPARQPGIVAVRYESHCGLLIKLDTTGYLSFGPMAQCVAHALKGWLAARVPLRLRT